MKTTLSTLFLLMLPAMASFAQTGTCEKAEAEAFLGVNNVYARIFNNGALFWNRGAPVYEVPKYGEKNAVFAAGIWIGGKVDNQLRVAGSTYGPWEFWPGPLDEQGNPPIDCTPYDHIYNIYQRDVFAYDQTGEAGSNLLNWPWELGAPVIDGDGDPNNYNLAGGDRPEIRGHQTLWWVMNDRGNVHERTDTDPIGLEVQVTAFSAGSTNEHIDNATLYKYKLVYKGEAPLEEAYFGFFQDVDLGGFDDDYVGSDTTLGMGYTYNSDNEDEGSEGYGIAPPAIGFDVVQGPLVNDDGFDNDNDGSIDEQDERLSMTTFAFYYGGGGVTGDPAAGIDFYRYMQGRWKDDQRFTVGGNGRDFSNTPTSFFFPGDPVTGEGWSELNPAIDGSQPPTPASDRQSLTSTGPFTMQPGDEQEITIAVLWARGEDHLASITALREASIEVQQAFDEGFNIALPQTDAIPKIALLSPGNGAETQPIDPVLHWQASQRQVTYRVELSRNASFTNPFDIKELRNPSLPIDTLTSMATYYWRVRAMDAGQSSPWSDTWQFTTSDRTIGTGIFDNFGFMATQNAAGPITPPDMAAFAFNSSGFPILEGNLTPVDSYPAPDRPTQGVQQSTNDSAWGIHTGVENATLFHGKDGPGFVGSVFRNESVFKQKDSFEWRFPQSCLDQMDGIIEESDCLAFRAFEDSVSIEVPFELWNIGEASDSTDDFRMIPFICEEACDAGTEHLSFDIAGDHMISGGENDPFSDWIFWINPADNGAAPGDAGYRDFFFARAGVGDEIFANMVLVQWNGGHEWPYEVSLPEPGTVFRIVTDNIKQPLLAAPTNNEIRSTRSTSFYWHAASAQYQLQVDTSPEFLAPLVDLRLAEDFYTIEDLPDNQTYYWRVRVFSATGLELSGWSETWHFTIPLNVGSESSPDEPLEFTLAQSYPNPFQHISRIRYALPRAAEVQLAVYDTLGRRISILQNQHQPAGWHEATFDGAHLANGVYFYRLTAGDFSDTKTMILMR